MSADFIISILMLAGLAMLGGAFYLFRQRGDRKKIWLMIVAALVMFGNVAIWLVPTPQGVSLAGEIGE